MVKPFWMFLPLRTIEFSLGFTRSFIHSLPAGTSDFPATTIDCDEKIARRVQTEHRLGLCYFRHDRVITPDARRYPRDSSKKIARPSLKRTLAVLRMGHALCFAADLPHQIAGHEVR
jgi:hypothetical protein